MPEKLNAALPLTQCQEISTNYISNKVQATCSLSKPRMHVLTRRSSSIQQLYKVVTYTIADSAEALPGLFCRSMEPRPADVNFLDDTSFRFSRTVDLYSPSSAPPANFSHKDRRASGELYFRSVYFPRADPRSAYLVLRRVFKLMYICIKDKRRTMIIT